MNLPILLLRLEGPLQSWGGRSRWDVRDTGDMPTKSGVMGLLGCALGYPMGDPRLEELDRALRFGVRVEAPGQVLEDYQTITDFLPMADGGYKRQSGTAASLEALRANPDFSPATIISPRFYLEDASFLVALAPRSAEGSDLLHACAEALQAPQWPLFLGRKACVPTRPIFDTLTDKYPSLEVALQQEPHSWLGKQKKERPKKELLHRTAFVEDASGFRTRQDVIRTRPGRQYGFLTLKEVFL